MKKWFSEIVPSPFSYYKSILSDWFKWQENQEKDAIHFYTPTLSEIVPVNFYELVNCYIWDKEFVITFL